LKRKRNPIVLSKLSTHELRIMTAELCTGEHNRVGATPTLWSRRFSASGKHNEAPKLRIP